MSFNIINHVSIINLDASSYQYLSDPFHPKNSKAPINNNNKNKENFEISKDAVFQNGLITVWKEVTLDCDPRMRVIPIYPYKNRKLKIHKTLQIEDQTVKLNFNRFFKLDLSGMDSSFCAKFSNKKIILINGNNEITLEHTHSKEGINFRTPDKFDVDNECLLKIAGDNSDLYSVNIEIANLKV